MTAEVFKIALEKHTKLKEIILQDPSAELLPPSNPYESFRIKYDGGLIVGYTSGKIVANTPLTSNYVGKTIEWIETGEKNYTIMIGSDEAGKGEWLGPITVAAVALTPEQSATLTGQGVMDSKLLPLPRIIKLAEIIKREALNYHILFISPARFNLMMSEVKDEGKSLNDMLAWAHSKVIENVYDDLSKNQASGKIRVLIDEFDKLKTEKRLWRLNRLTNVIVEQRPTAEEEIAVAAASILARAKWEEQVDREAERLKIDLRNLSPMDALNHPDARLFAKISYIRK